MAVAYITEFERPQDGPTFPMQAAYMNNVTNQYLAVGAEVKSSAFAASTKFIRFHTDAACHIAFGANPTAVNAQSMRLAAGQTEYFGVNPGEKVSVIASS